MIQSDGVGLLLGAVALSAFHRLEPGHGWPVAAAYVLDQKNEWLSGFAASVILGGGHLISSLVMVAIFLYFKAYFSLTQVNEPIPIDLFSTTIVIGGPVSLVAGVLLILLGIREYYGGHSHGTSHAHGDASHTHTDDVHTEHSHKRGHDHENEEHRQERDGLLAQIKGALPFVGGHSHDHSHGDLDEAAERGLIGIAWFAFVLGFAHEKEFEIIALCAGSSYCLQLMIAYAITVIAGIVGLTMLLIAGYQSYEENVERYTPYLPAFSAAVLVIMGIGFVTGLF